MEDTKSWIKKVIEFEGKRPGEIHFILSEKEHIRQVNKQFLNHDYDTDVISFADNRKDIINGEIFICMEVVKENADRYHIRDSLELMRVIVHGVLHLMGYEDSTEKEKARMSRKEDEYLNLAEENDCI